MLLAVLLPAGLSAQVSERLTFRLTGGGSWVLPSDVYDGEIFAPSEPIGGDASLDRGVELAKLRYSESLDGAGEVWLQLGLDYGSRTSVALRGTFGGGDLHASYSGQAIGEHPRVPGRLSWQSAGVVFGVGADARRLGFRVYGGPSITRYRLNARQRPRSVPLLPTGYHDSLALHGFPLRQAAWADWGGLIGIDLRHRLSSSVTASVGFEQRISRVSAARLEEAHRDAYYVATRRNAIRLRYQPYTAMPRVLNLSVSMTLGHRERPDLGPLAVAAVRERQGREGGGAGPQGLRLPPPVQESLFRGDTLDAIQALDSLARQSRHDSDVLGMLGFLLATQASSDELDFTGRARARELLERALALDPTHPRWFLGLSILHEKRGTPVDARVALNRALEATLREPGKIDPNELAEIFFRRGQTLERQVQEFEELRFLGPRTPAVTTPECEGQGAFCLNWSRPRAFFEWFVDLPDLTDLVEEKRAAMLQEYRRALSLVPDHPEASRALLGALARRGEWKVFAEWADRWVEAAPDDPWGRIFAGAALYRESRVEEAGILFESAVPELPDDDRWVFENLHPILHSGPDREVWARLTAAERARFSNIYWRRTDPLYLTAPSERQLEHYTRVALAEILFGEPQSGRRGWESDRGQILVRYGVPSTVWQVRRDDALVLSEAQAIPENDCGNAVIAATAERITVVEDEGRPGENEAGAGRVVVGWTDDGVMVCGHGEAGLFLSTHGGGRWIFWNYDPDEPSFVFEKRLGRMTVRHMSESLSYAFAEDLEGIRPTTFTPGFTDAGPILHQLARFRGDSLESEVEVHARAPVGPLGAEGSDSIDVGIFVFSGRDHRWITEARERRVVDNARKSWLLRLPPDTYAYSVEAARPDRTAAAVSRGELVVDAFSPSELRMSDLLLAERVAPMLESPTTRRELEYDALTCLVLPQDERLSVIFELYGLHTDEYGRARYRIEIDAAEAEPEGFRIRLLRGLRNLVRRPAEAGVSYEREATVQGDRVLEWLDWSLPADLPDETRIRVRVTDLGGGETTSAERVLAGSGCEP